MITQLTVHIFPDNSLSPSHRFLLVVDRSTSVSILSSLVENHFYRMYKQSISVVKICLEDWIDLWKEYRLSDVFINDKGILYVSVEVQPIVQETTQTHSSFESKNEFSLSSDHVHSFNDQTENRKRRFSECQNIQTEFQAVPIPRNTVLPLENSIT